MASKRDIRTQHDEVLCDVCGRTLLRGEQADPFLAGGSRKLVCDLCTDRAQQGGWIRENGGDSVGVRRKSSDRRSRSLVSWTRNYFQSVQARQAERSQSEEARRSAGRGFGPASKAISSDDQVPGDTRQRNIHAIPTNAELKMQRALDVFNQSGKVRTVGGVARSLGAPAVSVRSLPDEPSVVAITVMWELSWYRFEVDLSDERRGVRQAAQGTELSELSEQELLPNAVASQEGLLALQTTARQETSV